MMETGSAFYARQHGKGLTLPQRNAVDLLAVGKTDTEAAGLLRLHRTTISKWRLYDPLFQSAFNRRRAEVWESGIDRLRALIPEALEVLAGAMTDPENPDRMKAAVALLKLVPLTPEALAPGPADPGEIVRRIAARRRELRPSSIDNQMDLRQGRQGLEDECYAIQLELERRAVEEPEGDGDEDDGEDENEALVPTEEPVITTSDKPEMPTGRRRDEDEADVFTVQPVATTSDTPEIPISGRPGNMAHSHWLPSSRTSQRFMGLG